MEGTLAGIPNYEFGIPPASLAERSAVGQLRLFSMRISP